MVENKPFDFEIAIQLIFSRSLIFIYSQIVIMSQIVIKYHKQLSSQGRYFISHTNKFKA